MDSSQQILREVRSFQVWSDNQLILTGEKQQLTNSNIPCREIRLYAPTTNTEKIYIGSTNLTTENASIVLEAGDPIHIQIDNVKNCYVIGTNADKINFLIMV